MSLFLCKLCKRNRRVHPSDPRTNTCMRCKLFYNKPILLKAFNAIISQPDMKAFDTAMEQWFV